MGLLGGFACWVASRSLVRACGTCIERKDKVRDSHSMLEIGTGHLEDGYSREPREDSCGLECWSWKDWVPPSPSHPICKPMRLMDVQGLVGLGRVVGDCREKRLRSPWERSVKPGILMTMEMCRFP